MPRKMNLKSLSEGEVQGETTPKKTLQSSVQILLVIIILRMAAWEAMRILMKTTRKMVSTTMIA